MNGPTTAELAGRVLTPTTGAVHTDAHHTERIAAEVSKVSSSKIRLRVLAALSYADDAGCTDPELEQILELPRPTPGNRRGDLVKLGLATKAYRTRPHPVTGNPCQVWLISVRGLAVLTHLGGPQAALAIASKS